MKDYKGMRFWVLGVIILLGAVLSCTDNVEADLNLNGKSYVMFINAVPESSGLSLFVDDTLVGQGMADFGVTKGYYEINKAGTKKTEIVAADGSILLSQNVFLKPEQFMSIFAVRKVTSDSLIYVLLLDKVNSSLLTNQGNLKGDKAYVRFVNVVPDTLAFDLNTTLSSDTTANVPFSNATFGSSSAFSEIKAGDYKLELRNSNTEALLRTKNVKLEEKQLYTIWVGGLANGTGTNAINMNLINNTNPF